MEEHHFETRKTARYFTLGELGPKLKHIWFVCHGYGQLPAFFMRHFSGLENEETLIVGPEGMHRYYLTNSNGRVGASWMTKEDRLTDISDYIFFLDNLYENITAVAPNCKITVLGFSQGAATVCRWLAHGKSKTDNLILWAGTIPPDLDLATGRGHFQKMNVKLLVGNQDEFADTGFIQRQKDFLQKEQIQHEFIPFQGKHVIVPSVLKELAARL